MSAQTELPKQLPSTVMGFDYGTKKIGLATGQSLTCTATPIKPIAARDGIPNWEEVASMLDEWQPMALVVGVPLHMDGKESELTRRARKFANRLQGRFQLPTFIADETLTTFEAKLHWPDVAQKHGWPKHFIQQNWVDSLAAALIVESWMRQVEADNKS